MFSCCQPQRKSIINNRKGSILFNDTPDNRITGIERPSQLKVEKALDGKKDVIEKDDWTA